MHYLAKEIKLYKTITTETSSSEPTYWFFPSCARPREQPSILDLQKFQALILAKLRLAICLSANVGFFKIQCLERSKITNIMLLPRMGEQNKGSHTHVLNGRPVLFSDFPMLFLRLMTRTV